MNEYLKQYIELQKQFRETEGNPDSVRALYAFKEKLEQSEDKQTKAVLVDVYDLLDFKKDAYELLRQIGNRSNKKMLKRLGVLKDVYKRQVEGCKVGYCYREEPDGGWDSGWRFTAGDESDEYMDDPNNRCV